MKNYYFYTKLRSAICFKSLIMDLYYQGKLIRIYNFVNFITVIEKSQRNEVSQTSQAYRSFCPVCI